MIQLDFTETILIKILKLHFGSKKNQTWLDVLVKAFSILYVVKFEKTERFQFIIFNKLFRLLQKIDIQHDYNLEKLFEAVFMGISETPLERGIMELCSMIQNSIVLDRYSLDIVETDDFSLRLLDQIEKIF